MPGLLELPSPAQSLMSSGPLTAAPRPAPRMREFGDALAARQQVYDNVLDAAGGIEPLKNDRHTLALKDVGWIDPDHYPRKKRKEAVLTGETVARRLRGTWELSDNLTGKVIDRRQQVVARVPYLSSMGTFIHRGNEYTVNNQQRLRAGVFARVKDNGELESHFNIMPGKGVSHRYFLDPEKGVFKLRVAQSEMPLMPLLRAMGTTDREIRDHWGDALWQANYAKNDAATLNKLKAKFLRKADEGLDEGSSTRRLAEVFGGMELDPEVTQRTLGHPHANVTKEAILAATRKLLQVNRGEADPDDRDHLAYQTFHGPEDLFAERIRRDHGRRRAGLFRKVSLKGDLSGMPSGALTPQIEQVLLGSGLAQALEEINPAEVLDKQSRITRLGEGGIPSIDAIPDEARAVQPSHMGFMDPLRTPECYDEDTEVMTRRGWVPWPHVEDRDEFACLVDGRLKWCRAEKIHVTPYKGELLGVRTATLEYLVTPNHRLWVRPKEGNGLYRVETAEESYGRPRVYTTSHQPYVGNWSGCFEVPVVERLGNNTKTLPPMPLDAWCELVGWYLGEGLTVWRDPPGDYRTLISQSRSANHANCRRIEALLDSLDMRWSYNSSMKCYVLCGKQLTSYFRQFGYSQDRFIPEEFFDAPASARRALLESLLLAEGRRDRKGRRYQFCSTSPTLAEGVQRLAFSLGLPTTATFERDDRQPQYLGCHVVHMQGRTEREAFKRNYFREDYDGHVYCATVPGGLLYVRRGRTSGHWSGNSFRVGVDVHMARGARKGNDGRIYTRLRDRKGGLVWKSPQDIADAAVATPEVSSWDTKRVPVMKGGKLAYVPKNEVDYVLPNFEDSFSPLGNLIPLKSMVKGQRVAMGSRYLTQALPLRNAEAPLVQAGLPGSGGARSFEEEYGKHMGAVEAGAPGRVESFRDGVLRLRHADGSVKEHELYDHYPFNRKTYIHQTPLVKPGDTFAEGQPLVRSNYTDENGATALGVNLRVAYLPWKGYNFEDAQVISESAAREKLVSEHMYQHDLEVTDRHKTGKKAFISLFPQKFDRKTLDGLDERGVVRPGQAVEYGQPLVLAARERDRAQNKVHKRNQAGYHDESILWKHHDPGTVTDVVWGKNGPVVLVKSASPMQVGDKLSGRYGDKGVVAAIVPDEQMPHDRDGKPFEILLNPLGIISRTNPSQKVEAMLGKIARKTGKPFKVPDFEDQRDMTAWAQGLLRQHGLSDTEDVIDPEFDHKIPNVATGHRFFMKLHHTAESKGQGRGSGGYSQDDTPSKGGETGCFTGDTEVKVRRAHRGQFWAEGVPIGQIVMNRWPLKGVVTRHVDDELRYVWDGEVTDWFHYRVPAHELVKVTLEDGRVIQCTRNHEIYLADGTTKLAGDLQEGDDLMEARW